MELHSWIKLIVSILGPASPDELTPGHPARNVCLALRGYYESPWPHRPGTPIKIAVHSCYQFLITNGLLSILSLQSASVAPYLSDLRHEKGFFPKYSLYPHLCSHLCPRAIRVTKTSQFFSTEEGSARCREAQPWLWLQVTHHTPCFVLPGGFFSPHLQGRVGLPALSRCVSELLCLSPGWWNDS